MPKVTIDGEEFEVPQGTTILQAALSRGKEIPHFCYHPGLSIAGNCRICLVEVEKAPKLLIACQTQVMDGMVVKTQTDPTIPDLRYADEAVLAAIVRALQLCTEHAGPGCEVTIRTIHEGRSAVLRIETVASTPFSEPSLPIKLRSISLSDLVQDLGGELSVQQDSDHLTVSLVLGVDLPTR